jgi:hypothetical protein
VRSLVLVIALAACKDKPAPAPTEPPAPAPPPPQPVGACNNLEGVKATCSIAPAVRATEPAPQPETVLFDVAISVDTGATGTFPLVMHLSVPADNAAELERTYHGLGPTPCTATIIRPPCNPSASFVTIPSLPVPAYARAQF